ncbi:MAG: hypothetical protein K9J16_02200 [Melioribacteraceae bacterium]|nr:hypothetical protein [Melioribacteraceae bacterium]MCF8355153.1 hypothetical protein [Melioribacteraceae bacterium]MCF8392482.1 hypothetical protein [Melioribacteraceae bacterium]MCF8418393.1 hypothetical protein [Melioribacteraceae bacterium]
MNKFLIKISILFLIGFQFTAASQSSDTLDQRISELVKQEMISAQMKMELSTAGIDSQTQNNDSLLTVDFIFYSLIASFILNMFLFFRLIKGNSNGTKKSGKPNDALKMNISKLREEKISTSWNTDLSKVRQKLRYSIWNKKLDNSKVIKESKKMSIAQGELLLASKLNMIGNKQR